MIAWRTLISEINFRKHSWYCTSKRLWCIAQASVETTNINVEKYTEHPTFSHFLPISKRKEKKTIIQNKIKNDISKHEIYIYTFLCHSSWVRDLALPNTYVTGPLRCMTQQWRKRDVITMPYLVVSRALSLLLLILSGSRLVCCCCHFLSVFSR